MNEITALIDAVERYGFECEAGPLTNCVDWQKLRAAIAALKAEKPADGTAPPWCATSPAVQAGEDAA